MAGNFGMPRDLDEAIISEQFLVPEQNFLRARSASVANGMRVFAAVGGKYGDEAVSIRFYELSIDARTVVETLDVGLGD